MDARQTKVNVVVVGAGVVVAAVQTPCAASHPHPSKQWKITEQTARRWAENLDDFEC